MTRPHSTMRATRARWLRRIRQDRKLTQAKLAEKVGVTTNAISRYENGHDDPSIETLQQLLTALECWFSDLMGRPELPTPPVRRPRGDVIATSIDLVIAEFKNPSRRPDQYPERLRCWDCHGRPGECHCFTTCKVCGLLCRGGKCSGILH